MALQRRWLPWLYCCHALRSWQYNATSPLFKRTTWEGREFRSFKQGVRGRVARRRCMSMRDDQPWQEFLWTKMEQMREGLCCDVVLCGRGRVYEYEGWHATSVQHNNNRGRENSFVRVSMNENETCCDLVDQLWKIEFVTVAIFFVYIGCQVVD